MNDIDCFAERLRHAAYISRAQDGTFIFTNAAGMTYTELQLKKLIITNREGTSDGYVDRMCACLERLNARRVIK